MGVYGSAAHSHDDFSSFSFTDRPTLIKTFLLSQFHTFVHWSSFFKINFIYSFLFIFVNWSCDAYHDFHFLNFILFPLLISALRSSCSSYLSPSPRSSPDRRPLMRKNTSFSSLKPLLTRSSLFVRFQKLLPDVRKVFSFFIFLAREPFLRLLVSLRRGLGVKLTNFAPFPVFQSSSMALSAVIGTIGIVVMWRTKSTAQSATSNAKVSLISIWYQSKASPNQLYHRPPNQLTHLCKNGIWGQVSEKNFDIKGSTIVHFKSKVCEVSQMKKINTL